MFGIASRKTDAIKKFKPPTNITGQRSFLGHCNVFEGSYIALHK